jgi:hypothetical protein
MSDSEVLATIEELRAERDEARRWAAAWKLAAKRHRNMKDEYRGELLEVYQENRPGRTAKVIRQGTPVHSYSEWPQNAETATDTWHESE